MTRRNVYIPNWTWLAIGVLACFTAGLAIWPLETLMALLSDDAFYYLKIAAHIADGNGSTFDGVAPTNGYHPLWMLVVILAQLVSGLELILSASIVLFVNFVFCIAAAVMSVFIVRKYISRDYGHVAVAALMSPIALSAMTNGMETAMAILSVLILVWYCYRTNALSASCTARESLLLGFILAIVFLSRLDLVFLPIATGLLVTVVHFQGGRSLKSFLSRSICILGPFLLMTLPYLLFNYFAYGGLLPLSGTVKSSFPELRETLQLYGDSLIGLAMLIVLTILTAASLRGNGGMARPSLLASPLILVTLASWLHFAYVFLFMDWGVYWWHFSLSAASIAIALPAALTSFQMPVRWSIRLSAAFVVVCVVAQLLVTTNRYERHTAWLDAAIWARTNLDENAVFALKDAGLFSYFSERQVVNLDGKANGVRFWQSVLDGEVESYLDSLRVSFLGEINPICTGSVCTARILVPNAPDIFIEMPDSQLVYVGELYPSRIGFNTEDDANLKIWRNQEVRFLQLDIP